MKQIRLSELTHDLLEVYKHGLKRGDGTGWSNLDHVWSIAPGQLTVITGIPNHGKSAVMDALAMNLLSGKTVKPWKFLFISPEQEPSHLHLAELLERRIGKRFRDGTGVRMDEQEIGVAIGQLGQKVLMGSFEDTDNFAEVLVFVRDFAMNVGPGFQAGVVLDPWNRLEHRRPAHMSETEYVGEALSLMVSLARSCGVHIFVVAHPAKMYRDKANGEVPIPSAYDIAGSANWANKADNILCVWRDMAEAANNGPNARVTRIMVQKCRWRHLGRVGMAELIFDPMTGRFSDRSPAWGSMSD